MQIKMDTIIQWNLNIITFFSQKGLMMPSHAEKMKFIQVTIEKRTNK